LSIINAIMVPHPPIILPEIGRGEERKIQDTADAYRAAAEFLRAGEPETVVVISPHAQMYSDWFHISPGGGARGDFSRFGAPGVRFETDYDTELVSGICRLAEKEDFPAGTLGERDPSLDHAVMVPLYFLRQAYGKNKLPPIVRIGLSGLSLEQHYRLGMLISAAAERLGRRVGVIASGDLSHKLKYDGPYGFSADGPEYDRRIMDVMGRGAFNELFDFGDGFCESAGECGHRSFTMMAGMFDGLDVKAEKLSYQGPFGVGYGVCLFTPGSANPARAFYAARTAENETAMAARRAGEDEFVRLARRSVETFVKTGRPASMPEGLSPELTQKRAGVFVSLHIAGRLRGCIGTISPVTSSIASEILENGISACSRDPRFAPVTEKELPLLEYSVDVLGAAEDIDSPAQLDPRRYGVIVSNGMRRGLLLPDLEGVDTAEEQISIARRKAGIGAREDIKLQRFEVVRHV
jgi:AmmeMemoRadiSam system protein A